MVEEIYLSPYHTDVQQKLWQSMLQFADQSAAQERQRIARDLHDSVGHALTSLNLKLQTAIKLCQPDPISAQTYLSEAHELVAIAAQEVRQSIRTLRHDDPNSTNSLQSLIEPLITDFYQTTNILPQAIWNETIVLSPTITTTLHRIIQEALNNCRKYAQASTVTINLTSNSEGVTVCIRDDGRGFNPHQVFSSYGLRGMKERLELHQGELTIQTAPGHGCAIIAQIPNPGTTTSTKTIPTTSIKIGHWVSFSLDSWSL